MYLLLITDTPESISTTGKTISDHGVIYLIVNVRVLRLAPQSIRVRNFQAIDFQADFWDEGFQIIYAAEDANTKANLLTSEQLLWHHAPERNIVKRTPWITENIKRAAGLRNLTYTFFARNTNRARGDNQWHDYVQLTLRRSTLWPQPTC